MERAGPQATRRAITGQASDRRRTSSEQASASLVLDAPLHPPPTDLAAHVGVRPQRTICAGTQRASGR
jgi:hypothetical protein